MHGHEIDLFLQKCYAKYIILIGSIVLSLGGECCVSQCGGPTQLTNQMNNPAPRFTSSELRVNVSLGLESAVMRPLTP